MVIPGDNSELETKQDLFELDSASSDSEDDENEVEEEEEQDDEQQESPNERKKKRRITSVVLFPNLKPNISRKKKNKEIVQYRDSDGNVKVIDKEDDAIKRNCSVRIPLTLIFGLLTVSQVLLAVGLNWGLTQANSSRVLNDVTRSLRVALADRLITNMSSLMASPHLCTADMASAFQNEELSYSEPNIPQLFKHLKSKLSLYPQADSIYYGNERGQFFAIKQRPPPLHFSYTTILSNLTRSYYKINESGEMEDEPYYEVIYDPRVRPWYLATVERNASTWSEIYPFQTGGLLGITATTPVYSLFNRSLVGVVGFDISLAEQSEVLKGYQIGISGSAFAVDNRGYLVAASDAEVSKFNATTGINELIHAENSESSTVRQAASFLVRYFGSYKEIQASSIDDFKLDGELQFLHTGKVGAQLNWTLVIIIPKADYFEVIERNNRVTIVICAIALVISAVLSLLVSMCLSRPMRKLSQRMQNVAKLQFADNVQFSSIFTEVGEMKDSFKIMTVALQSFGKFVPSAVVQRIVEGKKGATRLHVEKRMVTIMFLDIVGFTGIAESVELPNLMKMLEQYYTAVSNLISETKGTVGEFIGDGIMAFWNSPEDVNSHAKKAVDAAISIQKSLEDLNKRWKTEISTDFPEVRCRIGIHTGEVLSGNVGSPGRMKFGLVGDPVNLASRLEGACKFYGTSINISEDTKKNLNSKAYLLRKLDLVAVKGKQKGVWIYEVCGKDASKASVRRKEKPKVEKFKEFHVEIDVLKAVDKVLDIPSDNEWNQLRTRSTSTTISNGEEVSYDYLRKYIRDYEQCLNLFMGRHFDEAKQSLEKYLNDFPNNEAALSLLKRVTQAINDPPTDNWSGIHHLEEK